MGKRALLRWPGCGTAKPRGHSHRRNRGQRPAAGGRCNDFGLPFMVQPLLTLFPARAVQKRPPIGGDERSEIFRWKISAKNTRPVAGPGGGRCPAARSAP